MTSTMLPGALLQTVTAQSNKVATRVMDESFDAGIAQMPRKRKHEEEKTVEQLVMENTSMLIVVPFYAAVVDSVREILKYFGYQKIKDRATMQHWQIKKLPEDNPISDLYHRNVKALALQGYEVTNAFLNLYNGGASGTGGEESYGSWHSDDTRKLRVIIHAGDDAKLIFTRDRDEVVGIGASFGRALLIDPRLLTNEFGLEHAHKVLKNASMSFVFDVELTTPAEEGDCTLGENQMPCKDLAAALQKCPGLPLRTICEGRPWMFSCTPGTLARTASAAIYRIENRHGKKVTRKEAARKVQEMSVIEQKTLRVIRVFLRVRWRRCDVATRR